MRRSSKSREEAEINVTPMLDIVFIMLIFFIVTATFAREEGLLAHTPPEAPPKLDDPPKNCLVEVSNTNRLSLNLRQTDLGGLRALLERCRAGNAEAAVIIRMAPDSDAGHMVRIANLALEAGVPQQEISYARGR